MRDKYMYTIITLRENLCICVSITKKKNPKHKQTKQVNLECNWWREGVLDQEISLLEAWPIVFWLVIHISMEIYCGWLQKNVYFGSQIWSFSLTVAWHHWILAYANPVVSGHSGTTCPIHKAQERGGEWRGRKEEEPRSQSLIWP